MSIDMSQFHQVFFEETGEHLASMENLLLGLNVADPDAEQLNAVFRAAHSIKGSSGTFGFTDLQDVTHILENLLDRVRKGELKLRDDMIDAFLDAGDVLKNLLAAHQGEGTADTAAADALCQRLRQLTEDAPACAVTPVLTFAADDTDAGLDVAFILDGAPETADQTIENLTQEFAAHGDVRIVSRGAVDQAWRLHVIGNPDPDVLRGLLEFVARNDSIRIGPIGKGDSAPSEAPDDAHGFFDAPARANLPGPALRDATPRRLASNPPGAGAKQGKVTKRIPPPHLAADEDEWEEF